MKENEIKKTHDRLIHTLYHLNILKRSVTKDKNTGSAILQKGGATRLSLVMAEFIASGCFTGYIPFAQGTIGSLWIPVLYVLLPDSLFVSFSRGIPLTLVGTVVILYFIGVWSAGICESVWGHDPGRVVIDEIVGMLVTLFFMPLTVTTVWLGFFLFRAFDIFKPQPVRWSERLPGGWGVMSDDVIAGIYANIFLRIGIYVFKIL